MKKLNNKGNTLIELVISIALMSVILISIVRLLVDLNNTNTNNVYAKNNQINRSEILRAIESDLNNKVLVNINDSNTKPDELIINLMFNDNTSSKVNVTKNIITYTSSNGNVRKWTMKDCSLYPGKAKVNFVSDIYRLDNISYFGNNLDSNLLIQKEVIRILYNEIYSNPKYRFEYKNSNILDDILISYYGKISDLNNTFLNSTYAKNSESCLGYEC